MHTAMPSPLDPDAPKLLIFEPYSEQQIAEIIRDRLKSCRGSPVSLDPGAVELCARKIALENGDARRALNVIRLNPAHP